MDHKKLKAYLEKFPQAVEIVNLEEILADSARGGESGVGYLKINVPDKVVKNLRGEPKKRDQLLLVVIPRDIITREESPIILPGL